MPHAQSSGLAALCVAFLLAVPAAGQQWDLAIRERQAAVNANPGDPSLLYDLGLTYAKAGRWAGAQETLTEALERRLDALP